MGLRITGGLARGRVLRGSVSPGVRPTTERVREALFSILGQDLGGQRVLDAFGGTGMVALEAWSRGADVTVIEMDRRALDALRRRGRELGATWTVVAGDAMVRAPSLGSFDGVFVDPPYAVDPGPVLDRLAGLATSWLVVEVDASRDLPDSLGSLRLDRKRTYGATALWIYRV